MDICSHVNVLQKRRSVALMAKPAFFVARRATLDDEVVGRDINMRFFGRTFVAMAIFICSFELALHRGTIIMEAIVIRASQTAFGI